jgi:anti-anti-sigma factor
MPAVHVPIPEIDVANADRFGELLEPFDPASDVVVNLADVIFCDSAAIRVLIAAFNRHERAGGSIRVMNLQPAVKRLFTTMGLDDIMVASGPAPV